MLIFKKLTSTHSLLLLLLLPFAVRSEIPPDKPYENDSLFAEERLRVLQEFSSYINFATSKNDPCFISPQAQSISYEIAQFIHMYLETYFVDQSPEIISIMRDTLPSLQMSPHTANSHSVLNTPSLICPTGGGYNSTAGLLTIKFDESNPSITEEMIFHELFHAIDTHTLQLDNLLKLIREEISNFEYALTTLDSTVEFAKEDLLDFAWKKYSLHINSAKQIAKIVTTSSNRFCRNKNVACTRNYLFSHWVYFDTLRTYIREFRALKASMLIRSAPSNLQLNDLSILTATRQNYFETPHPCIEKPHKKIFEQEIFDRLTAFIRRTLTQPSPHENDFHNINKNITSSTKISPSIETYQ